MNYSNHASRLQCQTPSAAQPSPKLLSLEPGKRGLSLRVRSAATMARRKCVPYRLPVFPILAVAALFASTHGAKAQLGYDPFAGNPSHSEERWARYANADTNGVNRPTGTLVNGVDTALGNATFFNLGVTAPNPSGAFITSGGNIYSFSNAFTIGVTSTYAPAVGAFNTVVFSLNTLGNPIDLSNVRLTASTGQILAPAFVSSNGGSGQSAFQFDLSGFGGSNNFSIALPGADSSVSFSSSQLDATTRVYGAQNVVPEPSSVLLMGLALGGFSLVAFRRRASI